MHKLFSKAPSLGVIGTSPILSIDASSLFLGLGFYRSTNFLFCSKISTMPSSSTSIHLHSSALSNAGMARTHFSAVPAAAKSVGKCLSPSFSNCRICKCSIGSGGSGKPWVVLKEKSVDGSRKAWFGTVASASGEDSVGETGEEKGSEEKAQVRIQRRQRNASGGSELQGNPDLLSIPGVGPRNLKKLVQNGIGGVAELKQLYKDKVGLKFLSFFWAFPMLFEST